MDGLVVGEGFAGLKVAQELLRLDEEVRNCRIEDQVNINFFLSFVNYVRCAQLDVEKEPFEAVRKPHSILLNALLVTVNGEVVGDSESVDIGVMEESAIPIPVRAVRAAKSVGQFCAGAMQV